MASNKDYTEGLLEHLAKNIVGGDSVLSDGDTKAKQRRTPKANIDLYRKKVDGLSSREALGATLDEVMASLAKDPELIYKRADKFTKKSVSTVHGVSITTEESPLGVIKTVRAETEDPKLLDAVLDLSDAQDKLQRSGDREKRAPEEWKLIAKKIRDHQKDIGTPKFREVAYNLFIEELKRDFPDDKRIAHISWDAFIKTYLGK